MERPVTARLTPNILDRNTVAIVILLLLAAAALRLPSLTLNSLWQDELWTASSTFLTSFKDWLSFLWNDNHPPLFSSLVYLWSLAFGNSEFALRLFTACIGIITVPIAFLVFQKIFGVVTAIVISIFILFLPAHIYYSQELRSYGLTFLATTVSLGILFQFLKEPTIKFRWALAVANAVLFSTHYISIFYIIASFVVVALNVDGRGRAKLAKISNLAFYIYFLPLLPNLPHCLYNRLKMQKYYWVPPANFAEMKNTIMLLFEDETVLAVLYASLILIAIWAALRGKDKVWSRKIFYLTIVSILPLAGVIAASLITPTVSLLEYRIIMAFAPPIIVLAAVGLTSIPNKEFTAAILLLSAAISGWWLYHSSYYTVPTKCDYRAVAHAVVELQKKYNDIMLISLDSDHGFTVGTYYWKMFGVQTDRAGRPAHIMRAPDDVPADEFFRYIRTRAGSSHSHKIALFAQRASHFKDLVELCDQHFRREDKRVFANHTDDITFLALYALN